MFLFDLYVVFLSLLYLFSIILCFVGCSYFGFVLFFFCVCLCCLYLFIVFINLDGSFDVFLSFGFDFSVSFSFDVFTFLFTLLVLVIFSVWFIYDIVSSGYNLLNLCCFSSLLYLSLLSLVVGNVGLFIILLECLSLPVLLFFMMVRSSDWFVGLSFMLLYSGFTGLFGFSSLVGFVCFDWF